MSTFYRNTVKVMGNSFLVPRLISLTNVNVPPFRFPGKDNYTRLSFSVSYASSGFCIRILQFPPQFDNNPINLEQDVALHDK